MSEKLLRVENIKKNYGALNVLKDISMTLERGHKTAIIGPSGCGKSTFLRCINFMETPSSGHIYLEGDLFGERQVKNVFRRMSEKQLARQRSQIGMVFQGFYLWPHLSVLDNVAIAPLKVRGMSKTDAYQLAEASLEKVHMVHKKMEFPERLSGGQQQRVAIARALAQQPKLILFDEPTSALDPELVSEVLKVIQELAVEGTSMVLVTHEVRFARHVADHVMFLSDGQVLEEGPPNNVLDKPNHERLQMFLKQILEH